MARKATYDQQKVTELRMEIIEASLLVLQDSPKVKKWSQYKKDLILKMSPRVLPVLQELSGRDGKDLPVPIFQVNALPTHDSNKEGISAD